MISKIGVLRKKLNSNNNEEENQAEEEPAKENIFGSFGKDGGLFKQGASSGWAWKLMFLGLGVFLVFGQFFKQRQWSYTEWIDHARKRQFGNVRVVRVSNPDKNGKEKKVDMLIGMTGGSDAKTISPDLETTLK